jgi:exonuclease III
MGDMNSLTRDDYSDEYFQKQIIEVRAMSCWEKPRFDLTKLITNEWKYQDAYKLINSEVKDAQISTCDYGTRIDYIYVHPRVINDQWIIKQCQIIDTKGFTDHNAVFAEFELKSK